MKICMFTNTYLPHVGGVARSVHFFAEDLRQLGHEVLIIAPTFPEKGDVDSERWVLRVPAIQNFNGSDFSVRLPIPFFIREQLDEFQPDVIHSHHPFLLGDTAIRVAYRRNLPLVFTHHTLYEQYTHYVSNDSEIMRQLAINLSTQYGNLCTHVVAPSKSIASLISKRGVRTPIEVIPTGVDVKHFQSGERQKFRRRHNIDEKTIVLGHLGRLAPEKNLDYLCHSVIDAMQAAPDKLCFLVVGDGPSGKRIEQLFGEAGLTDGLIMAGKKRGSDLVDAYSAMDLFLFSSKSETQGMVVAEAMAASLPVIALDASGVREVVEDNVNGRLLPEKATTGDFAESILNCLEEPGKREDWRRSALETAKRFSREISAEKMAALYSSLQTDKPRTEDGIADLLVPLDELVNSLKIEWDLLTQKASALMKSLPKEINEG